MRKYLSLLFIICLLFISCATSPRQQQELDVAAYVPESFEWEDVCPGVARYDFENRDVPLIYHAVRIDLSCVELVSARGVNAGEFAAREQPVVLINATPFDKSGKLVGIHREGGAQLSEAVTRYAAIAFRGGEGDKSGELAKIFVSQSAPELVEFPFAFGGFFTVVEGADVRRDFIVRPDSRTGAGLSADGRTLFLLVVEGEHPHQSRGLSYPECGEVFRAMGCHDALEFDGGGSAELCINGKSVLSYKVRRVHGNCFGFKLR